MIKEQHLKSHPDKTLFSHLKNSACLSEKIVKSKNFKNKDIYSKTAYLNGVAHDFAKSTTFFQDWLEKGKRSEKARHGHLSSLFGYYLVDKYLIQYGLKGDFENFPAISFIVINKHHGNLLNIRGGRSDFANKIKDSGNKKIIEKQVRDIKENHLDEVKTIYDDLLNEIDLELRIQDFFERLDEDFYYNVYQSLKNLSRKECMDKYVDIMFFYSVLLDSDKLDASGIEATPSRWDKLLEKKIVDQYKRKKFGEPKSEINKVRERAYTDVNDSIEDIELVDRLLSINLPTGSGKTLTALSAAFYLRKRIENEYDFTPKIIYSLPFLSIIDQNSSVFREVLAEEVGLDWQEILEMKDEEKEELLKERIPSNLLLTHHHLADVEYRERKEEDEIYCYKDLLNSLLLTEGWYSEIVVSTFVQLFHSLITNKNRAARKFHNITNSIIILDEVQSIPFKYWELVNNILRILTEKFNCWILFMTATKPLIFDEDEIHELASQKEEYFEFFDRIKYKFDLRVEGLDELKELILDEDQKDVMIVMNTISSCKKIYYDLKEYFDKLYNRNHEIDNDGICQFDDLELINLSTHILPFTRMKRINRIKNDEKRKIVVTTQLIEAGVDVSVDIIYRDFAPLDSIIQTAGRCNREFNEERGTTKIINLKDESTHRYYNSYIYDPTIMGATGDVIERFDEEVMEKEFSLKGAVNYYNLIQKRKAQDRQVLEDMEQLKFMNIANFNLIEEKVKSISLFVENSERAKKLRQQLDEELVEVKGFKRKEKLLKWRKELNEYTLSIKGSDKVIDKIEISHPPFLGNDSFRVIRSSDLNNWYDKETGFKIPDSTLDLRMI